MSGVATTSPDRRGSTAVRWRQRLVAILVGAVVIGAMAFLATLAQTPGLEGPIEIAPISVLVTVLSTMALPLVRSDDWVGYVAATLAGLGAVAGIALYLIGAFGPTRTAPAAYLFALLGATLVVVAAFAWRSRDAGAPGGVDRAASAQSAASDSPASTRR